MGVFHSDLVGIQVHVMQRLGANHVLVVNGRDGMDEISLSGPTLVGELKDGKISQYEIQPEEFGFTPTATDVLRVTNADESKSMLLAALDNKTGAARDIVALNAGAALYAANAAHSIANGIATAREIIASGKARAKVDAFVQFTRQFS
jgi:anthranilate phosphoribosyltransferase